ncbi:MAG TPA: methyltransferase domain-containing protein [Jatrophihabitans sp.]|jgi:SAM-dependent methyltransferase|uniref:methyltransferase domain-containing protein n=1 Tax=Jatrophihabitans sp. TaxID=1932789 RepID=UPI002DF7BBFB|nr:methyltransferase domain-containing protein [Jatrophihabitans sp.]
MELGALAPYERALRTSGPLGLRTDDGRVIALDVARWLAGADDADRSVVDRCTGPVLDVGCGPGRFVSALNARGIAALGVDIAETAVALTRGQGFPALLRSVFGDLPGEGRWPTVLLIDGNIGIGGDPLRLLTRIRALLRPGGCLVVETHEDDDADDLIEVRFTSHGTVVGPPFDWASVGREPLLRYAAMAGYSLDEAWSSDGRSFVALAA